jgi:ribosomal protein L19
MTWFKVVNVLLPTIRKSSRRKDSPHVRSKERLQMYRRYVVTRYGRNSRPCGKELSVRRTPGGVGIDDRVRCESSCIERHDRRS